MRVCVCENIYNIPPNKKRVDPPSRATNQKKLLDPLAGPQSKSLFDPAKKNKYSYKDYILKSVVFLLKIIKNKKK